MGSATGTAESSACVYGMSGSRYEIRRRRELDDLAEVHHGDAVGDVLDDREVVRDEQVGEAAIALQVLHQVDDLRLHRDVERRDRLVADDEARLDGERARDADALALAAGEFVRIARHVFGAQPDFVEQLPHARVGGGALGDLVDREPFADDRADGHARIERRERILEDDLDLAAQLAHRARVERDEIDAVELDASRRSAR